MRAGTLNDRVRIDRKTTELDGSRCPVEVWKPFISRWAQVVQKSAAGSVDTTSRQNRVQAGWDILLRRDSDTRQITADMRVRVGEMTLSIDGVVDDRRESITLFCSERPIEDLE